MPDPEDMADFDKEMMIRGALQFLEQVYRHLDALAWHERRNARGKGSLTDYRMLKEAAAVVARAVVEVERELEEIQYGR
jgi:hypothetical protein